LGAGSQQGLASLMPDKGMAAAFRRSDPVAEGPEASQAPRRRALHHQLPKAEHDAEEWQTAMEALLRVADHDGPTMFARIGVMQALNRSNPAPTNAPRRKRAKAYTIVR
jgi:hypothetical protein